MNFGKLLKQTRIAAGITQEEMAEQIHCSRSSISKLESDLQTLEIDRAVRWMQVVNRKDIVFALLSGIEPNKIHDFMFEKEYLAKVKESNLIKNIGDELTTEEVENFVLNKTREAVDWKLYLSKLTRSD